MRDDSENLDRTLELPAIRPNWKRDLLRGFVYALLIIVSILFFSGTASRFIYVDF